MRLIPRFFGLTLPLIGALLFACAGESSPASVSTITQDFIIADLGTVLLTEPAITKITSRSAVVEAVAKLDTVCAVAYGPTDDYGHISADSNMTVDGHRNHFHLLKNLRPDTEYHYVWNLVGPAGTVFRSQDLTFRTLPAEDSTGQPSRGNNLALLDQGKETTPHRPPRESFDLGWSVV